MKYETDIFQAKSRKDGERKANRGKIRDDVLRALVRYGAPASCADIARELECMELIDDCHRQTVAPRVTELVKDKVLEPVGREKDSYTGVTVTIYDLTDKGWKRYFDLVETPITK